MQTKEHFQLLDSYKENVPPKIREDFEIKYLAVKVAFYECRTILQYHGMLRIIRDFNWELYDYMQTNICHFE